MRKIVSFLLVGALLLVQPLPGFASSFTTATPALQFVCVNNKSMTKNNIPFYQISGYNYVMLRDVASLLDISVSWNEDKQAIELDTAKNFDGVGASTNSKVPTATAVLSNQSIYIDGTLQTDLNAYLINGNNYFKLRDIGKALDFSVIYDDSTNHLMIYPDYHYSETNERGAYKPTGPKTSGEITDQKIFLSFNDPASREDFSQQANPEIFNYVSREFYNAARQTYLDRELIMDHIKDFTEEDYTHVGMVGRNEYYRYAHYRNDEVHAPFHLRTLVAAGGYYPMNEFWPVTSAEDRDEFRIITIGRSGAIESIEEEFHAVLDEVAKQPTDYDKLKYIVDWISERLEYDYRDPTLATIFKSEGPVKSVCSGYERAFRMLASGAGFPVISLAGRAVESGESHGWNEVYIDGQWLTVDATGIDNAGYRYFLAETYTFAIPTDTGVYMAAKEIQVPGSTK